MSPAGEAWDSPRTPRCSALFIRHKSFVVVTQPPPHTPSCVNCGGFGSTGMESFTSFITRNVRINAPGLVGTSLSVYLAGRLYYAKIDYQVENPPPLVASFGHARSQCTIRSDSGRQNPDLLHFPLTARECAWTLCRRARLNSTHY